MIGNKMTNLEDLEIRFTTKTESYEFYTPLLKSFQAHQNLTKLELRVWKDGSRDDWPQTLSELMSQVSNFCPNISEVKMACYVFYNMFSEMKYYRFQKS